MGRAKTIFPTLTVTPSIMARVRGIFKVISVPTSFSLLIDTFPRSFSMLLLTTSIPTPLPDTSVTFSAVENPGAKIRGQISSSLIASTDSRSTIPELTAFAAIFSLFNPAPSSIMLIQISLPSYFAPRVIVPTSRFPFFTLSFPNSRP